MNRVGSTRLDPHNADPVTIETGTHIGPYEVQEFLGRGAMGVVYKAWHESLSRPAAVKVLQTIAPDSDATARFRREAQSIAQMRHPNVLNVFDFGQVEGVPYMIVEYVPGGSLGDRIKEARLSRSEAIRVLRGIAAALHYAHGLGVIHRDVKPANVLMHGDGTPVLADFGLAKLLESSSVRSATGATTGTPAYMAPEQVTGSAVGPPADRYALASLAYELLTGSVPFDSGGVLEMLYAQVHREPPPPSSRAPELPPADDGVLLRGLAKKPEERWDSCAAMIDALDHAFDHEVAETMVVPREPLSPAPVPGPAPVVTAGPRRRSGRPLIAVAVIVVLLVAAIGGLIALRGLGGGATMTADISNPAPGQVVQFTATHLPPNQSGTVQFDNTYLHPFKADAAGDYGFAQPMPQRVHGQHSVKLCWQGLCRVSTTVNIAA